jgi:peroxin-13
MGGYSSYGGGMGGYSSYGGMGGYSSYGGGMGGYGMGGYGMGGPRDPNSFMDKGLRFLDSFGFITNALCEVARNIEMNAEALGRLWVSVKGLGYKMTFGMLFGLVNFVKNMK